MTETELIAKQAAEILKLKAQVARLKKRLISKKKYEAGYLKATSTTPQLIEYIDQKDRAVLED